MYLPKSYKETDGTQSIVIERNLMQGLFTKVWAELSQTVQSIQDEQ